MKCVSYNGWWIRHQTMSNSDIDRFNWSKLSNSFKHLQCDLSSTFPVSVCSPCISHWRAAAVVLWRRAVVCGGWEEVSRHWTGLFLCSSQRHPVLINPLYQWSIMKILVSSMYYFRARLQPRIIAEPPGACGRGSESGGRSTGRSHARAWPTLETGELRQAQSPR